MRRVGRRLAIREKEVVVEQVGTKWRLILAIVTFAATVFLLSGKQTHAVTNVTITVPTLFATLDASDGSTDGVYNVSGDLTIANGGAITCDEPGGGEGIACKITINVGGNMEIQAGGSVHADTATTDGGAAPIIITTGGNFTARAAGGGAPAAFIS